MKSRVVSWLEGIGATNIEGYSLVSNYGYKFTVGSRRYDARFWANCYGVAMNVWKVHSADGKGPVPERLKERVEKALNKIGEE